MNNKLPVYPPPMTTAERDALLPSLRKPEARIFNTTTGQDEKWTGSAWVAVNNGGGSFTPLTYIAPPSDNDASRQAFLTALHADMVSKGMMLPPPMFTISGQVTGSVQDAITVELRDNGSNALLETVSTNGTGNYTFAARVAGVYKVIPAIVGHYFTPSAPAITLSANTVQNFVSAVSTSSASVSDTFVLVPQSGTQKMRAITKSSLTLNANLFSNVTTQPYTPTFESGRWFVPNGNGAGTVLVYEETAGETLTYRGTFTPVAGQFIFRVYFFAGKMAIVSAGGTRFGTYNFTTDVFTAGTLLANEVYPLDSCLGNGKIYVTSIAGGAPVRDVTVIDIASEIVVDRRNLFGGQSAWRIEFGDSRLAITSNNVAQLRIFDATSWAQIGSSTIISSDPHRLAFSQGTFFHTSSGLSQLKWTRASDGVSGSIPGIVATGCVADANYVYAAEQGNNRALRINASTLAVDGAPITGLAGPVFLTS